MEKMFSSMMERFTNGQRATSGGMSEEDKKKMKACGEQMVSMCPCMTGKEMSEAEKKAMAERMMACCGSAKEMMSGFFKKMGSQMTKGSPPGKTDKLENS
jgi:hypothetical protein